jgi:hypothetical protein
MTNPREQVRAAVDAYGAALRASLRAFRAYAEAACAHDDARAQVLDRERNRMRVEVDETRALLDSLLLRGAMTRHSMTHSEHIPSG